jgi:hypothetical protein
MEYKPNLASYRPGLHPSIDRERDQGVPVRARSYLQRHAQPPRYLARQGMRWVMGAGWSIERGPAGAWHVQMRTYVGDPPRPSVKSWRRRVTPSVRNESEERDAYASHMLGFCGVCHAYTCSTSTAALCHCSSTCCVRLASIAIVKPFLVARSYCEAYCSRTAIMLWLKFDPVFRLSEDVLCRRSCSIPTTYVYAGLRG